MSAKSKPVPLKECRRCGKEVDPLELGMNDGICDECDEENAQDDESWDSHRSY